MYTVTDLRGYLNNRSFKIRLSGKLGASYLHKYVELTSAAQIKTERNLHICKYLVVFMQILTWCITDGLMVLTQPPRSPGRYGYMKTLFVFLLQYNETDI